MKRLWQAWLRACGGMSRPWPSWYWIRTAPKRLPLRLFCWSPGCGRLKFSWKYVYCPMCRAQYLAMMPGSQPKLDG